MKHHQHRRAGCGSVVHYQPSWIRGRTDGATNEGGAVLSRAATAAAAAVLPATAESDGRTNVRRDGREGAEDIWSERARACGFRAGQQQYTFFELGGTRRSMLPPRRPPPGTPSAPLSVCGSSSSRWSSPQCSCACGTGKKSSFASNMVNTRPSVRRSEPLGRDILQEVMTV